MNDTYIVTVYVMIDDLLKAMHHLSDQRAQRCRDFDRRLRGGAGVSEPS
jgi:hypothetical protein